MTTNPSLESAAEAAYLKYREYYHADVGPPAWGELGDAQKDLWRDVARAAVEAATSPAAHDVIGERQRQISVEGWTPEHDDAHTGSELALAAACYALPTGERQSLHSVGVSIWRVLWPWEHTWWQTTNRRSDLVKAGALILAEIERIDRARAKAKGTSP